MPIDLLKIDEVAKMMRVSKLTIRRWYADEKIPQPIKIGGSLRWRREDLEQWVADGCIPLRQSDK